MSFTGKLKMTVRSSINPTPALPNIMQPKMPHDNKIPLQTIINNNLWKARALNDRNQITIKTPRGTFTLCAKTHKIIQHVFFTSFRISIRQYTQPASYRISQSC